MKRLGMIFLALCIGASSLFGMEARVIASFPNQVEIAWDPVKGAVWYDLYLDNRPIKRVKAPTLTEHLGSNEESLHSNREYKAIVAARSAANDTLDATQITVKTTSWSGHYYWVNRTEDDNRGRCKVLHLEVHDEPGRFEVFGHYPASSDKALKFFPLLPFADEYPWFDYWGTSEVEVAYRTNAAIFNTMNIEPKSWKIVELEQKAASLRSTISTKVGVFSFTTESLLVFTVSEAGEKKVLLHNTGSGLASSGIFKSPNPGENGVFVFVEKGSLAAIPKE